MTKNRSLSILFAVVLILNVALISLGAQSRKSRRTSRPGAVRRTATLVAENRSKDSIWKQVDTSAVSLRLSDLANITAVEPTAYKTFTLNPQALNRVLQRFSSQGSRSSRRGVARANADTQRECRDVASYAG